VNGAIVVVQNIKWLNIFILRIAQTVGGNFGRVPDTLPEIARRP